MSPDLSRTNPLIEIPKSAAFQSAQRHGESAGGGSGVGEQLIGLRGETLVLLNEYIPFGANNISMLEKRVECDESLRELHLTEFLDDNPERGILEIPEPEAKVAVMGHQRHDWIDFVAEVRYTTRGRVEVERLGTTVERMGAVTYSLFLERTGEQAGQHSLDDLARVIADLEMDTTVLIQSLLSPFQRRLLDLVYSDSGDAQDKYTILLTRELAPRRDHAGDYHREIPLRAELKQVLSQFTPRDCHDLSDGSLVIVGHSAMIVVTTDSALYEPALRLIGSAEAMAAFIGKCVARMWQTWDDLGEVKQHIRRGATDELLDIQDQLGTLAADINLFETVMGLVEDSIEECQERYSNLLTDQDDQVRTLLETLDAKSRFADLATRTKDGRHMVKGLEKELDSARSLADGLADKDLHNVNRVMNLLTVVSTIALPLTVIAGIYGMNFDIKSPWNMPELGLYYGYPMAIGLMATITVGLLIYFRRVKLI